MRWIPCCPIRVHLRADATAGRFRSPRGAPPGMVMREAASLHPHRAEAGDLDRVVHARADRDGRAAVGVDPIGSEVESEPRREPDVHTTRSPDVHFGVAALGLRDMQTRRYPPLHPPPRPTPL